jgi:hypothetical protein
MQVGSFQKGQGVHIRSHLFTFEECKFLALLLKNKYNLKTSIIKTGKSNQYRISILKESLPLLIDIVSPYFISEMEYKIRGSLN